MPARNATIEDLKKSYSYNVEYFEEQAKTTTICKGCDERISLYDNHVCKKYLEKYSDRTEDYDFASQIRSIINAGIEIDKKWLFKQFDLDYNEEKQKIQKEKRNYICPMCREKEDICDCKGFNDRKYMEEKVSNRVVEAMEKDKFVNGKATYSGTLNKCSMDLAAIKQLAGIDWGKKDSKSFKMISELTPDGFIQSFPANNWESHPIYLELKNNINIKCKVDNNGKITGTIISNLNNIEQWFLDFEKRCCLNNGVLSMSSWQNDWYQDLLKFQIQLIRFTEAKRAPHPVYEVGCDKPFYLDCAVCNQCDEQDVYKPKTENYTCQKCWPR